MITWKIEKRNIEELIGYDKNPRKFTKKGLKDLKKSLERLGDANIITINADNTVLGGHARLTVMRQLGYKEIDVKVPDKKLNENQVKEIVVRLNANTAGEWDLDKLEADFNIDELSEWGLDLDFEASLDTDIPTQTYKPNEKVAVEDLVENLPEELQGVKIEAEPFQEIVSTFKTERERVIITYPEEKAEILAKMLGLEKLEKIVYAIEDIIGE